MGLSELVRAQHFWITSLIGPGTLCVQGHVVGMDIREYLYIYIYNVYVYIICICIHDICTYIDIYMDVCMYIYLANVIYVYIYISI